MRSLSAFFTGLLFGAGLLLSGMTQPAKVIGFLDFTHDWDPSLAFVMGGALVVHAIAFRLVTRRRSPLFDAKFHLPTKKLIDARLLGGAALFGVGWGLGGICPGPGIVAFASFAAPFAVFIVAMLAGMVAFELFERRRAS